MANEAIKVSKLDAGLYEAQAAGRTWWIESMDRHSEGIVRHGWLLEELEAGGRRAWWNTFATKREALEAIAAGLWDSSSSTRSR